MNKQLSFNSTAIINGAGKLVDEYKQLEVEIDELKSEKKEIDSSLMESIRNSTNGYLIIGDKVLTIATDHKRHFRASQFMQEHPEIYNNYIEHKSVVLMRISELKDKED